MNEYVDSRDIFLLTGEIVGYSYPNNSLLIKLSVVFLLITFHIM